MYKILLGIDPGAEGAIAITTKEGVGAIELLKTVNPFWIKAQLTDGATKALAVIEKSQAMPGQGVCAMFNYGTGFGRIIGWVEALGIPYVLVPPKTWQKDMHQGCTAAKPKARSAEAAHRLLPSHSFKATSLSRKDHDGLIDAALIAEWGRRVYLFGGKKNAVSRSK